MIITVQFMWQASVYILLQASNYSSIISLVSFQSTYDLVYLSVLNIQHFKHLLS